MRQIFLVCFMSTVGGGCSKGAHDPDSAGPVAAQPTVAGRGPTRAQQVSDADRLAVQASAEKGAAAAALLARAAELREQSFRLEGRQVDGLEALELWGDANERAGAGDCALGSGLARWRAQMSNDPARLFRDIYLLRHKTDDVACQVRLDRALSLLEPFAPPPAELAEMRKLARSEVAPGAPGAHSGPDVADPHVVVPQSLEKGLAQPTQITRVEPFIAEQTARLVVHVTHPTKFQVGALKAEGGQGPRLFVDIENASYGGKALFETAGLVRHVRLGKQHQGTRVVLDLQQPAHHRVFYLPEPFRLVIDLSVQSPEALTARREIRRIVLDPGHGGHDPGAVGANGLKEKDVTLDIAHRAAPLLAREVMVSTLLTRDIDAFVPLDERAARANAFHADLFISIHLNSSENPATRGVMTFVLDASRDATAAQVAARENASTAAAAAELANSLNRIESSDRRSASELFAQLLQRAAGASLRQAYSDVEDHGVRSAGFYVLAGAAMPAVLFEGSFLSHPVEADRLNTEAYRQRLADALVNAVRAYQQGL